MLPPSTSGAPGVADDSTRVAPVESARAAGLRYITDGKPGIRRRKRGEGFVYEGPDGREVDDDTTLARIRKLAIPPAWTDVWIAPAPNAHLQATGRDAKGRKQYRYHPRWREVRDETKYSRMLAFAAALARIRRAVDEDLSTRGLSRRKVLATVVRLLETTFMRVGNEEYAKANRSFGLTTLRDRHVEVDGSTVRFSFKGKAGKRHVIDVSDRRLASVVKRCRDLPGFELFQYVDENGEPQSVDSADVNEYLRDISGEDFTAKDFRTWAGTVLAALALDAFEQVDSAAQTKKNLVTAIESVARQLGNTPAICRKCYVHPAVLEAYVDGETLRAYRDRAERVAADDLAELGQDERAVLAFLRERLARAVTETRQVA